MNEKTQNECPLCGKPTDFPEGIPHVRCADRENFLDQISGSVRLEAPSNQVCPRSPCYKPEVRRMCG